VVICRRCDRGNRYCPTCAPLARAEKQRAAGKRYQKTVAGTLNHKARHEQYKANLEKKVTHQADLEVGKKRESIRATLLGGHENRNECREQPPVPSSTSQLRCDFRGRPCTDRRARGRFPGAHFHVGAVPGCRAMYPSGKGAEAQGAWET
jgi:hypothetical protein